LLAAGPGLTQPSPEQGQGAGPGGASRSERSTATGFPETRKWWLDADFQRELGLSEEKVRQINALYEQESQKVQPWVQDFLRQSERLNRMTADRVIDVVAYEMQVAKVTAAGARLQESRTVMLYRIYMELTPEQYRKFQEIRDRKSDGRRRGSDGPGAAGNSGR
jgi:Spy/CpxP family protein refolding chaperone